MRNGRKPRGMNCCKGCAVLRIWHWTIHGKLGIIVEAIKLEEAFPSYHETEKAG